MVKKINFINKQVIKIIAYICYVIGFIGISLWVTHSIYSFMHETNHSLICLMSGLEPIQNRFEVSCEGIEKSSQVIQFFFFMMPYFFSFMLLLIILFNYNKLKFVKYFVLIPILDVIINYLMSLDKSDFKFLLQNTYPNLIPFYISIVLVLSLVFLTFFIIKKTKLFSFKKFDSDFFKNNTFS